MISPMKTQMDNTSKMKFFFVTYMGTSFGEPYTYILEKTDFDWTELFAVIFLMLAINAPLIVAVWAVR